MFRFTIRDVLWLTVVVGLAVLVFSERAALTKQRAALHTQIAAERDAMKKEQAEIGEKFWIVSKSLKGREQNLENEVRQRLHLELRKAMPVPETELEATKRTSIELGAPQPTPLPPGYGEVPAKE